MSWGGGVEDPAVALRQAEDRLAVLHVHAVAEEQQAADEQDAEQVRDRDARGVAAGQEPDGERQPDDDRDGAQVLAALHAVNESRRPTACRARA